MTSRILVAYASKYGSTAEIANKIGGVLREAGLSVNVMPAAQVFDLTQFSAVVLGSAVYDKRWRKEAVTFLEENEASLAKMPVWLFSSGPIGKDDPVTLMNGWRFPAALESCVYRIQPRAITLFHGAINMDKLNFAEKQIVKEFKAPVGDYRDWAVITSWASDIATALKS